MSEIISELEKIAENTQTAFGNFSPEQINWKSNAASWSVGQCFEHLIKTNELFFDELDKIAAGKRTQSFLENWSPLSVFFGNVLKSSLKKDSRKFKVPTQKIAPPSDIDPNIIEIFAAHQAELIGKIKQTETTNWKKIKVTSPFLKIATYSLANGYEIIVEHERRHFRQAERVVKESNFPK